MASKLLAGFACVSFAVALLSNFPTTSLASSSEVSSLMSAITSNDINGVKFFSKSDRSLINQKNIGGATALHIACRAKNSEIVQILVDNGANVDIRDNEGWTPLMRSSLAADASSVRILLSKGAKAEKINSVGESAILHAALSDCTECLSVIFEQANLIKMMDTLLLKDQITDAFIVARDHANESVKALLESYLDRVIKASPKVVKNHDNDYQDGDLGRQHDDTDSFVGSKFVFIDENEEVATRQKLQNKKPSNERSLMQKPEQKASQQKTDPANTDDAPTTNILAKIPSKKSQLKKDAAKPKFAQTTPAQAPTNNNKLSDKSKQATQKISKHKPAKQKQDEQKLEFVQIKPVEESSSEFKKDIADEVVYVLIDSNNKFKTDNKPTAPFKDSDYKTVYVVPDQQRKKALPALKEQAPTEPKKADKAIPRKFKFIRGPQGNTVKTVEDDSSARSNEAQNQKKDNGNKQYKLSPGEPSETVAVTTEQKQNESPELKEKQQPIAKQDTKNNTKDGTQKLLNNIKFKLVVGKPSEVSNDKN